MKAWAEDIGGVSFPLLSDFWPHGEVIKKYHVFRKADGYSERAIFIIDKEGIIRYIDVHDIDDQPSNEVLFEEIKRIQPEVQPAVSDNKEGQEDKLQLDGVMLFCNQWCPGCRRARIWLAKHNIDYIEVDVSRNPQAAAQVKEWTGGNLTTPTFYIHGEVVIDWKEREVARLLL
ncbi:MAG: redoxin domain-containing protein [Anaerolineales bacterium]|nr:redoxin domain-containing protein [Anaerolineales bacterium]